MAESDRLRVVTVRGRRSSGRAGWIGRIQLGSRSSGGDFVLLNDAGGDAPAFADRDAVFFRPRPDVGAALTARCTTPRQAARSPPGLAGMVDEWCELPPERRGVLGAQVDLVLGPADGEPHRLIRRAAIEIVFERDGYLLSRPRLLDCDRLFAPYKINCADPVTATLPAASYCNPAHLQAASCPRAARKSL